MAVAVAFVVGSTACTPVVATRGNMIDNDRFEEISVGQSTVNDVAIIFGSPTTVSTFDRRIWYYIGQRTEKSAFFDPTIVERRIVRVVFSDSGVVQQVEDLDLDDAQAVELVERETPTLGRRMTVVEQLLGNFGRFNSDSRVQAGNRGTPGGL